MSRRPRRVAVVGAGLAGTRTVAALRARGWDGHLTLVGAEDHPPYDRPPLSKGLLSGAEPTWLEADLGVDLGTAVDDLRLGTTARRLALSPDGVLLGLSPHTGRTGHSDRPEASGEHSSAERELKVDAVVLACGAVPVVAPMLAGALTLRTLDDAHRLRDQLRSGDRVVCVGAGWIGAEVATAAAAAGCAVTVVEAASTPLHASLGEEVGGLTARWYAAAGIELRTGQPVERLQGDGVRLRGGEVLAADLVVAGTGVRPDVDWLDGSGLAIGPGVRVDAGLRASDPRVWAVGDCATRWSERYHRWLSAEHWDEALRAPDVAATTLLGGTAAYDDVPYVFSTQLGHELALVGRPDPAARVLLRGDPCGAAGWSAAWVMPAGSGSAASGSAASGSAALMVAMFTVDRPRDLGQARRALGSVATPGVAVDPAVLVDPDVPLRSGVRPGLAAHPASGVGPSSVT